MTNENIKIEFGDGSVITVDDCYQNETLRKSWFDKVRSDIPRLQAALGRRYPTLADYQAELARVEELIRIELRADMDRLAQVAIFSAVMGNASVEEFVARISHKMATELRNRMNAAMTEADRKRAAEAGALMLAHHRGDKGEELLYSVREIQEYVNGLNYREVRELQRIAKRLSQGETGVDFGRNENPLVH